MKTDTCRWTSDPWGAAGTESEKARFLTWLLRFYVIR
ncbi:hypothetical protein K227x_43950 [Rubripirellula lacrimiformis]|uniref:Uncharacterized protein n=1 Tax=Rubripirellula lacrimiformis TaxID=1930273 RepID=A0A517NFY5_9BACT|nr:hypothetical protein K227x_43950 [Rubripirellula lacrimiformis]